LAERRKIATPIVAIIILAYFGFVLLIAFDPALLGQTLGGNVSLGIYAGLGLLVLSFVLTGIYMYLSDQKIAELQRNIRHKVQ
jgi:uncharacterized membrane protein (DUF485 family)